MSDQRSSSGVRNLRAVFESSTGSLTPPSRGRSPANSEPAHRESSRPLSKVRTSFISVERSGQMGSQLDPKEAYANGEESFRIDSILESKKAVTNSTGQTNGLTNGDGSAVTAKTSEPVEAADLLAPPTPQKPVSNDDYGTTKAPTSDPAKEAVSGSPIKEEEPPNSTPKKLSSPKSVKSMTTLTSSPRSPTNKKQSTLISSKGTPIDKSITSPRAARMSSSPKTPTKQLISSTSKPKAAITAYNPQDLDSDPSASGPNNVLSAKGNSGLKQSSSSATSIASKPATRKSPIAKPRPKSPTRPMRLPGAATAATAASAAKLDKGPPARPPSRAGSIKRTSGRQAPTLAKAPSAAVSRGALRSSAAANLRKTSDRQVPLTGSSREQKPARSRVSSGSSNAMGEDFLARMMRPTASSAKKAHEKVDVAARTTPPRKLTSRPKRKSAEADGDKKKREVGEEMNVIEEKQGEEDAPETGAGPNHGDVTQPVGEASVKINEEPANGSVM